MAHAATDCLQQEQHVEWMWKSNSDPFSSTEPDEWRPYSEIENSIIEEAFQQKASEALLDDYHINFKHHLQISNNDERCQRHVRRTFKHRATQSGKLREDRFMANTIIPEASFGKPIPFGFFSEACEQNFGIDYNKGIDPILYRAMVEKAAEGIIIEGKKVGRQRVAEWMAQQLLSVKDGTTKEIAECCARLYCKDSFLYRKLNEVMRLQSDSFNEQHQQLWQAKARTLGPYACLLEMLANPCTDKKMTVYRGANLTDDAIEQYRRTSLDKTQFFTFSAFTSTSRNRDKAELMAGNVLYILDINEDDGRDLVPYSIFDEEETLLMPFFVFFSQSCHFDDNTDKWIIRLQSDRI